MGLKADTPFVLRFPKGNINEEYKYEKRLVTVNWDQVLSGDDLNIVAYGPLVERIKNICESENLGVNLFNAKFIRPIDYTMLTKIFNNEQPILVFEEAISTGGLYSEILKFKEKMGYESILIERSIYDGNIPHLTEEEIKKYTSFDDISLSLFIKNAIG